MQLNPVKSHTLVEALLGAGTRVPGVPMKVKGEDEDGFAIFRRFCEHVVVFTGTHRFLDEDLPRLLEIMRTEGGSEVSAELKQRIESRVQAGPHDPRLSFQRVSQSVRVQQ